MKNKLGISLLVLIVTIIVIIILASVIVLSISKNNIIYDAKKAAMLNDIYNLKDAIEIKKINTEYEKGKSNIKLFGNIDEILGERI